MTNDVPTYGYSITVPIGNYRSRKYESQGHLSIASARWSVASAIVQDLDLTKDLTVREHLLRTIIFELGYSIEKLRSGKVIP